MDFIDILIKADNSISGNNLHERYKRNAKEALIEGYSYVDFFQSCDKAIIKIKEKIKEKYELEKSQINDNISIAIAEKNTANENKGYDALKHLNLSDIKIEVSELSKFNNSQTSYNRLSIISTALLKAEKELRDENRINEQKSPLSDEQIELLYKKTINIFIQTSYENFYNICRGADNFRRIEWIHKNPKGSYNRTSLNCFWNVLMGCERKPNNRTINKYFVLENGTEIKLPSPNQKQNSYNRYIRKFNSFIVPLSNSQISAIKKTEKH